MAALLLCLPLAAAVACSDDAGIAADTAEQSEYLKGFALVYWQASRLRNLDRLLLVKLERDVIESVTKRVADLSGRVADDLEEMAEHNPEIRLEAEYLPTIEADARDDMGFDIARELLFSGGCDFEQRLVFTEAVAVLRMSALAEAMANRAPDEQQESFWSDLHEESRALFESIRDLINRCPSD